MGKQCALHAGQVSREGRVSVSFQDTNLSASFQKTNLAMVTTRHDDLVRQNMVNQTECLPKNVEVSGCSECLSLLLLVKMAGIPPV